MTQNQVVGLLLMAISFFISLNLMFLIPWPDPEEKKEEKREENDQNV